MNSSNTNSTVAIKRWLLPPTFLLVISIIVSFVFIPLPTSVAVNPPPDGGYPNGNTAEGDNALLNLTSGSQNTALGAAALGSNTTGGQNTATGFDALILNRGGNGNTATGFQALFSNSFGSFNTGTGDLALNNNTTGSENTAAGVAALMRNTIGNDNSAMGFHALFSNTTGGDNTAIGFEALLSNTTGFDNTATGVDALLSNTTGGSNSAMGFAALNRNTSGRSNTATGFEALLSNTTGDRNTASGVSALLSNTTGNSNAALGPEALVSNTTGNSNTAIGEQALFSNITGSNNVAVGSSAGSKLTAGSNNIDIGNLGAKSDANTIRIGTKGTQNRTFIAAISGTTVPSGVGVVIGVDGKLGTVVSSARFKDEIKPMDRASEIILKLKPVSFHYRKELDPDSIPQFGLVAEEVEKVNPNLVVRDEDGKVSTVRYEAVNAMLLNEFLKEHRKVEEQHAVLSEMKLLIANQEAANARQEKEIGELRSGLQTVSDRLKLNNASPQLVASED